MAVFSFALVWLSKNVTLQIMTVSAEELKYNPQKTSRKFSRRGSVLGG